MDGKPVVITGATTGMGRATAFALGQLGASLILIGRNQIRGAAVVRHISASGGALAYCRTHLEDYMVPKTVEFCAELPKTSKGKIKKTDLS